MNYYIWNVSDITIAQNALDNFNSHSVFPIVGRNAKTKKEMENKTKITKWCKELTHFINDTVGFPKPDDGLLDVVGIDENERTDWINSFNPQIIDVEDDIFPPPKFLN